MDQIPSGGYLVLKNIARGIGLLTLLGYGAFIAFAFEGISPDVTSPLMASFAVAKLVHDALIAYIRYRLRNAFSRVEFYDVVVSSLAAVLLIGSITVQLWG